MRSFRLTYVSFDRVEFALVDDACPSRPVVVRVGSGSDWRGAVAFPTIATASTETTGDTTLDDEIRERAAEELVRLEAALRALRDAWLAT